MKSRRGGKSKTSGVDRVIERTMLQTGSTTSTVASDLVDRRQNMNLVQTPPKQIGNQIYWIEEIVTSTTGTSTTTFVENNSFFNMGQLTDASMVAGVFDQYCIYSVTCAISIDGSSPTGVLATVLTAIDYDNIASIGPSGIIGYSNCSETCISGSASLIRYIKPCLAVAVYSGAFTSFATQRCWVNSNSLNVQHYGLRCIIMQANAAYNLRFSYKYVVGLRNKF